MLIISEYNPRWKLQFEEEATLIREVFGADALRIEHVGSTSVEGLAAKSVIDIQISVPSFERRAVYKQHLLSLGYVHVHLGDFDRVYPFFEKPEIWPATHHVHLCVIGSPQEQDHLTFRDFLRRDPEARAAYVQLKRRLAQDNEGDTLESRERYSLSKTEFVRSILLRASADPQPESST